MNIGIQPKKYQTLTRKIQLLISCDSNSQEVYLVLGQVLCWTRQKQKLHHNRRGYLHLMQSPLWDKVLPPSEQKYLRLADSEEGFAAI